MQPPAPQTTDTDHNPTPHYHRLHAGLHCQCRQVLEQHVTHSTTEMHMYPKSGLNEDFIPQGANSHTMHDAHITQNIHIGHVGLISKCLVKISQHHSGYQYGPRHTQTLFCPGSPTRHSGP